MRTRLLLIVTVVALVGCQMPFMPQVGKGNPEPASADQVPAKSIPALAGRVSFGDQGLQATMNDVGLAATVSLINTGTNQTVSTALTNASGEFVLTFSNGYVAEPTATYYLEASKGLNSNQPGHEAVRVRTVVRYQDGWTSISNISPNQGIVVNSSTTALSIGAGLANAREPFAFASLIGALSGSAADTYEAVGGLSAEDFQALRLLVANVLAADRDPVRSIGLHLPSTWHRLDQGLGVTGIAPESGSAATLVTLTGTGFSSIAGAHAVSFNGVTATVASATPVALQSHVPQNATSGQTTVRMGDLIALGPNFTVPVEVSAVSPESGAAGTEVTLTGSGFGSIPSSVEVSFNGVKGTVTQASATMLKVIVPETSSGPLTVSVNGTSSQARTFQVPVVITSLAPDSGPPGMQVTIAGQGFSSIPSNNEVLFNGVAADVTAASPTGLTVTVPTTNTGPVSISVGAQTSVGPAFTVITPALHAVSPAIASAEATLWLEGKFASSSFLSFPGGGTVPVTQLGAGRGTVVVPHGATSGSVTLIPGGATAPFAAVPSDATLQPFQMGGAMSTARFYGTLEHHGNYIYLLGGATDNYFPSSGSPGSSTPTPPPIPIRPVYHAAINADGTLGAFTVTGNNMPREFHNSVVIGNTLYVLGGYTRDKATQTLSSIVKAVFQGDGSLSHFSDAGTALITGRRLASTVIVGNYLYVTAGRSPSETFNSVERALIHADGTLGPFEDAGVTLKTARSGHSAVNAGKYLYVLGGHTGSTYATSVERALIQPDGTLGDFETVGTTEFQRVQSFARVIGGYLYVMGGSYGTEAERAAILADGSLGPFETTGFAFVTSRRDPNFVVAGNRVYAMGGDQPAPNSYKPVQSYEIGLISAP